VPSLGGGISGSTRVQAEGQLPESFLRPAIPGYEILEELGRGGMGVVYKARQERLDRVVALKMIRAGPQADGEQLARFAIEARAVARLEHPNIVQIHEVGEHAGQPYCALEFVNGGSLADRLQGPPLPAPAIAELMETLARAMHHAHEHGIVHRDLKPGNILLTADGVPKVTDFGLAKQLDVESNETHSGVIMGTPSYMAPEQAWGKSSRRPVGPPADLWALGAILYALLTGRPPFRAETGLDTIQQVRCEDPVPPSRLQPRVARDLETICLKCLRKDPQRRYASAAALADDLHRFREGEPILARPVPGWERALKWARRRPALASLVALSVLLLLAGVGYLEHRRRHLQTLRTDVQELMLAGQAAFSSKDLRSAQLRLTSARTMIGSEPALADLKAHVEQLLEATDRQLNAERAQRKARQQYQEFGRLRDDALFYGTLFTRFYGTLLPGMETLANQKTRAAVEQALALFEGVPDAGATPVWLKFSSPAEKADAAAGCCELRMVLAEAEAQPLPGQSRVEQRRQLRHALRILEQAARRGPPTRAYHLRRARYLERLGEDAAACKERQRAGALQPVSAVDHFLLGDEEFRQGKAAEAARHFDRALLLQPEHFWAQYFLAVGYVETGNWRAAKAGLTACLGRRPDFLWLYPLRGFAHGMLNHAEAAAADFARALRLRPDAFARYVIHVSRGYLRLQQGKLPPAVRDLERALALLPRQPQAHVLLAAAYREQKQFTRAARQLDAVLALQPPPRVLAHCRAEQGRIRFLEGEYARAVQAFDAALRLQPDLAEVERMRIETMVKLDDWKEVAAACDRYLARHDPVSDVHLARAQARTHLHDAAGAVEDFSWLLARKPDWSLHAHRGWAYLHCEAWQLALRDFERAVALNPRSGAAHHSRGIALVKLGRYRQGIADAETALRLGPAVPELLYNVACVFAQAAARAEADGGEPNRQALAAGYRDRALALLHKALDQLAQAEQRTAFWQENIQSDRDLDPLRQTPEFQKLQAQYGKPDNGGQAESH
jgi:serine/threonine protein kinase/Tfp pilus assembly protein PilF